MALQKTVNLEYALGVPGCKATPDQSIYTAINYFADANGVTAGTFCWLDANGDITNTRPASGAPLGFVQRDVYYPQYNTAVDASMVIAEGESATVAIKGDYYAVCATAATVGDQVYAAADGTLTTTSTNNVATGWYVKQGGAIGETIIISNWA